MLDLKSLNIKVHNGAQASVDLQTTPTEVKVVSEDGQEAVISKSVTATRKDIHLGRRVFHMTMGCTIATLYWITVQHHQAVYVMGIVACLVYVFDQMRISYPEVTKRFEGVSKYLMRAEEQLKESAMIPYIIAIFLTILSFPKMIAISSIYTLAVADPLSAIIGIKFGKHRVVKHKSLEGSAAFFTVTFFAIALVFNMSNPSMWAVAFIVASLSSIFEMLPIRLDDNLTIPLFVAGTLWVFCTIFGIPVI